MEKQEDRQMWEDRHFMGQCLRLAASALEKGDHPFGAIVVKDGQVVAEAENAVLDDIVGHAEVNALRAAAIALGTRDLSGCTLYANCEPCAMCAVVIRNLGVSRVVFGIPCPKWGGRSRWNILEAHLAGEWEEAPYLTPPIVVGGIMREEATKLLDDLDWKMHKEMGQ